jgi:hypothetical protein
VLTSVVKLPATVPGDHDIRISRGVSLEIFQLLRRQHRGFAHIPLTRAIAHHVAHQCRQTNQADTQHYRRQRFNQREPTLASSSERLESL